MKEKEISEIRRHLRRDRSNMTAILGCFVNDNKQIISQFRLSTGMMPENEGEKYFALLKRTLSGSLGKNLVDITFKTQQVADSPEHGLLMKLRDSECTDEEALAQFYEKIIAAVTMDTSYLILLGSDRYDVPFKGKDGAAQADGSDETYRYILCSICPVKLSKPVLEYKATEMEFHDSAIQQQLGAPVLGFLFPAFDNRSTNLYNALLYTKDAGDNHEEFVTSVFNTRPAMAAKAQKQTFEALISQALEEECSMEVVQAVQAEVGQMIQMHKESKVDEPLMLSRDDIQAVMSSNGISQEKQAKFRVEYDEAFGFESQLFPKNVIDTKVLQVTTPDVSIKVNPERADLIETRIIGGVPYILICADESVEVNGVPIHIPTEEAEA